MTPERQPAIKICGITSLQDALLAIDAGADLLGFIFVPGTPRSLTLKKAEDILSALPEKAVQTVGVFQNASTATIAEHLAQLPLDAIQLHGDEDPEAMAIPHIPLIKRLPLTENFDWAVGDPWIHAACWLLDPPKGQPIDWRTLALKPSPPGAPTVFLAGGLSAENVTMALHRFPWAAGVDVASGVEASPGKKDPDAVRAFCQTIRPPSLPDDLTTLLYPAVQNERTD